LQVNGVHLCFNALQLLSRRAVVQENASITGRLLFTNISFVCFFFSEADRDAFEKAAFAFDFGKTCQELVSRLWFVHKLSLSRRA